MKLFLTSSTTALLLIFPFLLQAQQVNLFHGPDISGLPGGIMNRIIDCDSENFYSLSIRSENDSNYCRISKYDKSHLKQKFTVEINYSSDVQMKELFSANSHLYIFTLTAAAEGRKSLLNCQVISDEGLIKNVNSNSESIAINNGKITELNICMNPLRSGFLIQTSYLSGNGFGMVTDFRLLNAKNLVTEWTKTVTWPDYQSDSNSLDLNSGGVKFFTLDMDDQNNIFYTFLERGKMNQGKPDGGILKFAVINHSAPVIENQMASLVETFAPQVIELPLKENYTVEDLQIYFPGHGKAVIGGCFTISANGKAVGSEAGIFFYKLDLKTFIHDPPVFTSFDVDLAGNNVDKAAPARKIRYKLDNIFFNGTEFFFTGQKYSMAVGDRINMNDARPAFDIVYEYGDIFVSKLTPGGDFKWVNNVPFRDTLHLRNPQLFKRYLAVATGGYICIMHNDNPDSIVISEHASDDEKQLSYIEFKNKSLIVLSSVSASDGKVTGNTIMNDVAFPFGVSSAYNPMIAPNENAEFFISGNTSNSCIIYTGSGGKDRFSILTVTE